ncbi:MAG: hypothetical protein ACRETW_02945 [Stenotrophobium sp.]
MSAIQAHIYRDWLLKKHHDKNEIYELSHIRQSMADALPDLNINIAIVIGFLQTDRGRLVSLGERLQLALVPCQPADLGWLVHGRQKPRVDVLTASHRYLVETGVDPRYWDRLDRIKDLGAAEAMHHACRYSAAIENVGVERIENGAVRVAGIEVFDPDSDGIFYSAAESRTS